MDEIVGVVRASDLLVALEQGEDIAEFAARTPPIVVPETMDVIKLLAVLRRAKGRWWYHLSSASQAGDAAGRWKRLPVNSRTRTKRRTSWRKATAGW